MNNSTISLTSRAADHVRSYLAKQGDASDLRIAIKPTGCSGYKYVVETSNAAENDDNTFESQGINIVIDSQSLPYLTRTVLDYIKEGVNEGFRFNNPNVQETCGCGESFTISEQTS